ncbi:MAG: alpha/beta fold hydrolase [Myxococcaceae bacterium]
MRVAALCLLFLAGCPKPTTQGPPLTPCIVPGVTREARCLALEVPENPDAPTGRKLRIHAAVVAATGIRPLKDPLFIFAGGPGQSATEVAGMVMSLFSSLDARRDLVFVDQRGTGKSAPLGCLDDVKRRPLKDSADDEKNAALLVECRDGFIDAGVDLAQYATWIAMRDVDAVRAALGYDTINLWGASYGTRAAMEYARQFPQHVRSVVIDGVAPAMKPLPVALAFDTDLALDQLLARSDGGMKEALEVVLAPDAGVIRVNDPYFGTPTELVLERKRRVGMVRGPLYGPMLAAALPTALERAAAGDWAALVGLGAGLGGGKLYAGMHFSVICAEDVPRITDADRAAVASTRAGTTFIEEYERACKGWPVREVPKAYFEPPTFPAPTLILSGGVDPATPPRHAAEVARTLPNATHFIAPQLGHGVSSIGCAPRLVHTFIMQASATGLDAGCLEALPTPTFFEAPAP